MPRETPPEGEWNRTSTRDEKTRTILFVDDEPVILAHRRIIFKALGYSVLTAGGGAEALSLLQVHPVDAVVLDFMMRPMDGEETARNIRRTYGKVRIILSSGRLSLPESILEVVDVVVEKGRGVGALIQTLERLFPLTDDLPASDGNF